MSNPARAQDSHQLPYQVYEDARQLNDTDMEFIAEYTKVPVDALHDHVLRVWQRAKQELWVYKCIQEFMFLIPKISRHPFYQKVMKAHEQSMGGHMLHLDVGCCLGQDTRRLLTDGWGQHQLVAIDLVPEYWNMGKVLFLDEDKMKVPLLTGSLTNDGFISASDSFLHHSSCGNLVGAVDFLWAAAVLHVLSKADCAKFITNVKLLLKPGGGFYGWTVGNTEAGDWVPTPDGKDKRYLHSMESLHALFLKLGFSDATVDITSRSTWSVDDADEQKIVMLCFSATK